MRAAEAEPEVLDRPAAERSRRAMAVKRGVQAGFLVLVAPRLLARRLAALFLGPERAFHAASESIARIPGSRGVFARQAFYRRTLTGCGRDVYFGWQSVFSTARASVSDRVYIGRRCSVGLADIGEGTLLADGVQILSGRHQHGRGAGGQQHRDQRQQFDKVRIGAGVWLGTNAVVMADVGDGAIVGAGAVVTKPVPAGTVAAGVPATVLREIG